MDSDLAAAAIAKTGLKKADLIFQPGFRKGRLYLMEERAAAARKLEKPDDKKKLYVQEETDWDVEAVVDEDQL